MTKSFDQFSAPLLNEALQGEGRGVVIYFSKAGAKGMVTDYLTLTLSNVLVSSHSMSSGGDRPTESLSLNFTKIEFKTAGFGAGAPQPQDLTYDLVCKCVLGAPGP